MDNPLSKAEIRKIVTGVSACQELFVRAREAEADAVLVHHGIFWGFVLLMALLAWVTLFDTGILQRT